MQKSPVLPLSIFFVLATGIITTAWYIIHSPLCSAEAALLSGAITADLCLLIPLTWFLAIRKTRIPNITVIPLFLGCLALANALLPETQLVWTDRLQWLAAPLEIFALGYAIRETGRRVRKFREIRGESLDFGEALSNLIREEIGDNRLAKIVTDELNLYYFAFVAPWKRPAKPEAGDFTVHRKNGYAMVAGVLMAIMVVETFVVHLAIDQWSATAAWALTALSIYGLFFVWGDLQAIRRTPVRLHKNHLSLALGLRWELHVPLSEIEEIRAERRESEAEGHLKLTPFGGPNVLIRFKKPQKAKGLYGFTKTVNSVSLFVDEKNEFLKETALALPGH